MPQIEHVLWDEWIMLPPVSPVEDEVSGIIDGLSYVKTQNEVYDFTTSRLFIVRRLMFLWPESEYKSKESSAGITLHDDQQKGRVSFCLKSSQAEQILARSSAFPRRTRNWNWIRGVFGSCGSLYIPKAGYYLTFRFSMANRSFDRLEGILKTAGFTVGSRQKNKSKEIILRDQQQIVTFLSRLGLIKTALALEDTAIYRLMRNHANKLVNCDAANINKSLTTAQKQLELIKQIENLGLQEGLPEPLRDLMSKRKLNPSMSLRELGQILSKPISKSAIEYRFRKLENLLHKQ